MLIKKKIGNIKDYDVDNKFIDRLQLQWYETNKRILHKKTTSGKEIILKFFKENQQLTEGDILFEDSTTIIAVEILPCDAIIIKPKNDFEIAAACYEIGNKHLPLFFCDDELLIAFEEPLYNLLNAAGYNVKRGERKLIMPLKTSVKAHASLSLDPLFTAASNINKF